MDYREKIKKLLVLAESKNEHEARAALLKARQLMAEHKLTEADCKDASKQKVVSECVGITFSKQREPWIAMLSAIIGENYCCRAYMQRKYKKKTSEVAFIGLEEDYEVCKEVFCYAVDCVRANTKQIKKENACYSSHYATRLCDSFGYGFTFGVAEAFRKQQEENESKWGLVLATPKEVDDAANEMEESDFHSRAQEEIYGDMYAQGYKEGKKFNPGRRIAQEEAV